MKKFSLTEVIEQAMQYYKMAEKDDNGTSVVPEKYRKAFLDYLKKTNGKNGKSLLENAIDLKYKPDNKKEKYFFTEHEKDTLLFESPLRFYCMSKSTDMAIKKGLKQIKHDEQEAQEERLRYHKFQEEIGSYQPYAGTVLSFEEADQEIKRVMISELFELFFTPIDRDYIKDKDTVSFYGGDRTTAESIAAAKRLTNSENYYQFNPDNPRLNKILDMLADKITERLAKKSE